MTVSKKTLSEDDDYILYHCGIPIAAIEVKDNNYPVAAGMQQALDYAATLDVPFVFATNGDAFVFHDRSGKEPRYYQRNAVNATVEARTASCW